jgi:hypothetical protein
MTTGTAVAVMGQSSRQCLQRQALLELDHLQAALLALALPVLVQLQALA